MIPPETPVPPTPGSASQRSIIALILGVLSLSGCCGLPGPIAWYMAHQELKAVRQGLSTAESELPAKVALILGAIGTVILAGGLLAGMIFGFGVFAGILHSIVSS